MPPPPETCVHCGHAVSVHVSRAVYGGHRAVNVSACHASARGYSVTGLRRWPSGAERHGFEHLRVMLKVHVLCPFKWLQNIDTAKSHILSKNQHIREYTKYS